MNARTVTDRNGVEWCFGAATGAVQTTSLLMARRSGDVWRNSLHHDYPSITAEIAADLAPLFAAVSL